MEFPMISDDLCWRFSGAVRRNDNRRTRTHAPSGVNLNTSVNTSAAERPRGGKPRGLTRWRTIDKAIYPPYSVFLSVFADFPGGS